ncbi:MAG: AraC family transcriptional regulator [Clostridiales bacterium]|nr:AraC family transcriptional regulator [Clostridiales bacterium]
MTEININTDLLFNTLKSFYTLTKLKIVVFNENYEKIISFPEQDSLFCSYIQTHPLFKSKCEECVKFFCENCKAKKGLYINQCHAGLTEAVLPLIDDNDIILGYIMFGQTSEYATRKQLINHVKKVCQNVCKLDDNSLNYLKKIQLRPTDEILSAAEILKAIGNYITINQFIAKKANYFMLDLYSYIDQHVCDKITVDDICKNLYISKTKLYSLISKELPDGLNNYIMNKKLSIVLNLLYSTNKNLSQIAKEVGIDNANYLCKLFKKSYNITPTEYRKKFR